MNGKDLEGDVLIVTGGSRGIGREIVLGGVARGARVVFCSRRIDTAAENVVEEGRRLAPEYPPVAVAADVSRESDVEHLFNVALATFGKVDAVVNNAAISQAHLLVSLPTSTWDQVVATNLTGAFLVARQAVREFLARNHPGKIISVGSIVQNGAPSNAAYAVSKGGLLGLTRAIAAEYGHLGISATLVVGGYVETRLTEDVPDVLRRRVIEILPLKRFADGSEIARVILACAAKLAPYMNGASFYAAGGLVDPPPAVPK